jgi:uncharacterized protein
MENPSAERPSWQPISAIDRRVLGVLAEKAKTTPDAYPLTLNALTTGCSQKNNRYPLMDAQPEDVQESVDRLRGLHAVAEVQGSGRVPKFRHLLYEWMGVEKQELAVMAELLLRGAQTEGDLRGRASRMDSIPDLTALRGLLDSLKAKGLVISLSPPGRGHVVSHALYLPQELEKVQREFLSGAPGGESPAERPARASASDRWEGEIAALREEVESLRSDLEQLRQQVSALVS